jgi:hypothetical protein
MKKQKENINGVFGNWIKSVSHWFLYIFIDASANLPKSIMDKRKNQIYWLKQIDKFNLFYNYNQLVELVRAGIQAKYKKSPELVLQIIFDNATRKAGVSGVADNLTFDAESNQYYDAAGNAFILDSSGNIVTKNGSTTDLSVSTGLDNVMTTTSGGSSFWTDCANIITWIVDLLKSLGIGNTNTSITSTTPSTTDWANLSGTSSASFGNVLPYVVVAAIVFTALSGSDKKKKKPTN